MLNNCFDDNFFTVGTLEKNKRVMNEESTFISKETNSSKNNEFSLKYEELEIVDDGTFIFRKSK